MQEPSQGQANPQHPPAPSGEAPSEDPTAKRQQEDEVLARAQGLRGLHATLDLARKGPWPEPQQAMSHWSFLLQEMRWLATDVYQVSFPSFGKSASSFYQAASPRTSQVLNAAGSLVLVELRCLHRFITLDGQQQSLF